MDSPASLLRPDIMHLPFFRRLWLYWTWNLSAQLASLSWARRQKEVKRNVSFHIWDEAEQTTCDEPSRRKERC